MNGGNRKQSWNGEIIMQNEYFVQKETLLRKSFNYYLYVFCG